MFLSEKEVEDELCRLLAQEGITYQRQVYLGFAGIADVATEDIIYEVKKSSLDQMLKKLLVNYNYTQLLCRERNLL